MKVVCVRYVLVRRPALLGREEGWPRSRSEPGRYIFLAVMALRWMNGMGKWLEDETGREN
jgi:hypothetical protein